MVGVKRPDRKWHLEGHKYCCAAASLAVLSVQAGLCAGLKESLALYVAVTKSDLSSGDVPSWLALLARSLT